MIECKFIKGKIPDKIIRNNNKLNIGATAIFEGTVRSDIINNKKVVGIEFSTQNEIATEITNELLNLNLEKYSLLNAIIYHRIDYVKAGDVCFKVVVESVHRKEAFDALRQIVDDFKATVPVFGKEILEDNTHEWKQNK